METKVKKQPPGADQRKPGTERPTVKLSLVRDLLIEAPFSNYYTLDKDSISPFGGVAQTDWGALTTALRAGTPGTIPTGTGNNKLGSRYWKIVALMALKAGKISSTGLEGLMLRAQKLAKNTLAAGKEWDFLRWQNVFEGLRDAFNDQKSW